MTAQPASKKLKLTPPRPSSSRSTPEATTRRAVANGTTTANAVVPVAPAAADSAAPKHNNVPVSRLDESTPADETSDAVTAAVVKPSLVEAKASPVVLPQNSAVVAPALSHSAKVLYLIYTLIRALLFCCVVFAVNC